MNRQLIERILRAYGVSYRAILPPQKGYRNSSYQIITAEGALNVILYKREVGIIDRVARANAVGDFLAARGLPTRQTYDSRLLGLQNSRGATCACVYYYLPGDTIPWEAYTMRHIKAVGETMAHMHRQLKSFTGQLPLVTDELSDINSRMRGYFANPQVATALGAKLGVSVAAFDYAPTLLAASKLPIQALHMDFVRGNILFNNATITGVLDFEKAAYGPPIIDIARTLAFLLVDCKYKTEPKVRKYFLQSGYIKRGKGTLLGDPESFVTFFLLYDFYKFLRHNPYESLISNEHFKRTRAILLQRGAISVK